METSRINKLTNLLTSRINKLTNLLTSRINKRTIITAPFWCSGVIFTTYAMDGSEPLLIMLM